MITPNWHPIFVHFTVALTSTAFIFMLLMLTVPKESLRQQWRHAARWTLWLAGFMTLFTLLAGFQAFYSVAHDEASHQAMIIHRNWALAASGLLAVTVFWSISCSCRRRIAGYGFLSVMALLVVVVTITAWHGAELVYRHGMGVLSIPDSTAHGQHSHTNVIDNNKNNNVGTGEASEVHSDYDHKNDGHDH